MASSIIQADKVRENRLRRVAARHGYHLVKSRRRDPMARDFGLYVLVTERGPRGEQAAVRLFASGAGVGLDEIGVMLGVPRTHSVLVNALRPCPAWCQLATGHPWESVMTDQVGRPVLQRYHLREVAVVRAPDGQDLLTLSIMASETVPAIDGTEVGESSFTEPAVTAFAEASVELGAADAETLGAELNSVFRAAAADLTALLSLGRGS